MIVGGNAGRLEFARFGRADFAKCDTNFHPERADFANDFQDALEFFGAVAHAAPGGAHAKPGRALRARTFCHIDNLLDRQ